IAGALGLHLRRKAGAAGAAGGHPPAVAPPRLPFAAPPGLFFWCFVLRDPLGGRFPRHPAPDFACCLLGPRAVSRPVPLLLHLEPRLDLAGQRIVQGALLLLAVANVAQWPRHREISLHSDWFPKVHDQSTRLKASLRDGKTDPEIWGAYREFLHFARDLSPRLASRITADVREGSGFHRTEMRDGRGFAGARRGAALALIVGERGDYALNGELWLRPLETVTISRGDVEIARVSRTAEGEGAEPFALTLSLPRGRTELAFGSNLEERDVGG